MHSSPSPSASIPRRRGFSLIEVLLALFILAIGLVMVASIFPVAGAWTRHAVEENVAQTVARSALATLQLHYTNNGEFANHIADFHSRTLAAFPGIDQIWTGERAYHWGAAEPYPARNFRNATYFWTALARLSPTQPATSKTLDVYILVFRKGDIAQTFPYRTDEVAGARNSLNEDFVPNVVPVDIASPAFPLHVGDHGLALNSATVFQMINSPNNTPTPNPPLPADETQILISPPAQNTTASPLIYIYQTTLNF